VVVWSAKRTKLGKVGHNRDKKGRGVEEEEWNDVGRRGVGGEEEKQAASARAALLGKG